MSMDGQEPCPMQCHISILGFPGFLIQYSLTIRGIGRYVEASSRRCGLTLVQNRLKNGQTAGQLTKQAINAMMECTLFFDVLPWVSSLPINEAPLWCETRSLDG